MEKQRSADIEFGDRAFLVRDAVRQGFGEGVFNHPRWHRPFRGVRSKLPLAETLQGRALQYLPRLRIGERFSHGTALALMGCPIRVPAGSPVDVSAQERMGRPTCRGAAGHRHRSPAVYALAWPEADEPIPVTPPLTAVQQCADHLPFPELVVALDHLLLRDSRRFDRNLWVSRSELDGFAAAATGAGAVRFRAAAGLVRIGSESRMETLMRLAGAIAGMPELRLQLDVRDAEGRSVGRFDAADEDTRSLFEYDGGQHLSSRAQRRRDAIKLQAARDADWRVKVFYAEDLVDRLAAAGRSMLDFSGRSARPVPSSLVELLSELHRGASEPAAPWIVPD